MSEKISGLERSCSTHRMYVCMYVCIGLSRSRDIGSLGRAWVGREGKGAEELMG